MHRKPLHRADLEAELKQMLVSARLRLEGYMNIVEELEREELECDLEEYRKTIEEEIAPVVRKALLTRDDGLLSLAQEVREVYDRIVGLIEEKLGDERKRG